MIDLPGSSDEDSGESAPRGAGDLRIGSLGSSSAPSNLCSGEGALLRGLKGEVEP